MQPQGCWGGPRGIPGASWGCSHAAAGGDLPSIPEPGDLRLREAGDAGRADDGGLPVGHALLRLAVLEAPHVCRTGEGTVTGAGERLGVHPGSQPRVWVGFVGWAPQGVMQRGCSWSPPRLGWLGWLRDVGWLRSHRLLLVIHPSSSWSPTTRVLGQGPHPSVPQHGQAAATAQRAQSRGSLASLRVPSHVPVLGASHQDPGSRDKAGHSCLHPSLHSQAGSTQQLWETEGSGGHRGGGWDRGFLLSSLIAVIKNM